MTSQDNTGECAHAPHYLLGGSAPRYARLNLVPVRDVVVGTGLNVSSGVGTIICITTTQLKAGGKWERGVTTGASIG